MDTKTIVVAATTGGSFVTTTDGINNNSGVRIFEMSNGDWKQVGNDIEGLAEVIVPAETPVIVRYDQAPNCGSAPTSDDHILTCSNNIFFCNSAFNNRDGYFF